MHEVVKGGYTVKQLYAVYRSRVLILNPKTRKDAIFKSKREADLVCQEMCRFQEGFFVAPYYGKKENHEKVI